MRKYLSIVLFFLFFQTGNLASQDGYPRNPSVDITHYKFELKISDNNDSLFGKTTISLKIKQSISQLTLDFQNVTENGQGMLVLGVEGKEGSLTFNHKGEKLVIDLSADPGEYQIGLSYKGVPKDGLIISENKHGDRTFFCDNWPNRAHQYLPVIDHPYEKATSEFIVTAPVKYQVISNGVQVEVVDLVNGMRRTAYRSYQQLPTKVMVFGAARFAVRHCNASDFTPVSAWVYPQEEQEGFSDYCSTTEILSWFVKKIGPYPYYQLANVQSKTRYGGMENAGCIFYHENSIDGKNGSEGLFAHEIAHQWFGNSASEADWHHVWLSEGFATYLTEVYKQEVHSDAAFREGMERNRKRVLGYMSKFPNSSIIDTTINNLNRLLNPCTYQKAAWFLHMLRNYVGDEAFWESVRSYYKTNEFGNSLTSEFMKHLEQASGESLTPFFNAWLYQPGVPEFQLSWKKNGSIKVEQVGKYFYPVKVRLTLKSKQGEDRFYDLKMIEPVWDSKIELDMANVTKVILDADNDVLKGK